MYTNSLFCWMACNVKTNCALIETSHSPGVNSHSLIGVGVALDGTGWGIVQQFHHTNVGGFRHLLLESGECNTNRTPINFRATPSATGHQTEQQKDLRIQYKPRIMNKESVKQILISHGARRINWRSRGRKINWRVHRGHREQQVATFATTQ
jgi:hypothetical protein